MLALIVTAYEKPCHSSVYCYDNFGAASNMLVLFIVDLICMHRHYNRIASLVFFC